jgi:3-oxoacyl-[acyl-carrier-protein] synthase-3
MGLTFVGTGRYLPPDVATNEHLARVMDTTADWITQRTGITERHFAGDGVGASDLGAEAAKRALAKAKLEAKDVDYVIMSTMTPDHHFPGPAAMVAAKLGIPGTACLDVRQQCASFIYQLQLAHALVLAGQAKTILLIGAEAHAGFMPWEDWEYLYGRGGQAPSKEAYERATKHRGLAILFGDGAGAVVVRRTDDDRGVIGVDVHSDGRMADYIHIPSGFTRRPYTRVEDFADDLHIPRMKGKELFKQAVTRLPESVRALSAKTHIPLDQVDLFIAHQANDRINGAVRDALGVPAEKVPSNIQKLGNTSAATIPILLSELDEQGKLKTGMTLCFLALGAGLHWGSAMMRI